MSNTESTTASFIFLLGLLVVGVVLPRLKIIWGPMDRFAFKRPTLVKYYVLIMCYLAFTRTLWYVATTILGNPDPTVPFVLNLGLLPPSWAEFPFSWLLPQAVFPWQAFFLMMFLGISFMIYGWLGLPKEGLNRAIALPNRVRPPMFFLGFHMIWIVTAIAKLTS